MSWFRRTIRDDAKDFETQLQVVKLILYRKCRDYSASQINNKELAGIRAAGVMGYLTGEDLDYYTPEATKFAIRERKKIKDKIPELADSFMKLDKDIRELVIYTLRMRAIIVGYIFMQKGLKFVGSPEFERMDPIMQKYGGEFPIQVNPKLYAKIVNREMKKDTR